MTVLKAIYLGPDLKKCIEDALFCLKGIVRPNNKMRIVIIYTTTCHFKLYDFFFCGTQKVVYLFINWIFMYFLWMSSSF